jgi:hypothetical protein
VTVSEYWPATFSDDRYRNGSTARLDSQLKSTFTTISSQLATAGSKIVGKCAVGLPRPATVKQPAIGCTGAASFPPPFQPCPEQRNPLAIPFEPINQTRGLVR